MVVVGKSREVPAVRLDDGKVVRGVTKRVLIGPEQGAPNFVMRLFTLNESGYSPRHTHAWEHEIYILSGRGTAVSAEREVPIGAGDFIYIPANELHQLRNAGSEPLEFLCLVPRGGEQ
jgi:quercetin dioxygenase-like cupin family protein